MQSTDEPALRLLSDLIHAAKDAEAGYQAASLDISDAELARLFADYAVERGKFVADLQQRVRDLRGDPENQGTVAAALHRGWIDLKAALAHGSPHAVLEECERGEDLALLVYREALQLKDLDDLSHKLIQRQYELVQAAHDRVRQLRDRLAPSR